MSEDDLLDLIDECRPVALDLVGAVHDEGPNDVKAALARIPEGGEQAMLVLLAAMVDPTRTPGQLLGWTEAWCTEPTPAALERRRLHELGLSRTVADTIVDNLPTPPRQVSAEIEQHNPYVAAVQQDRRDHRARAVRVQRARARGQHAPAASSTRRSA